MLTVKEIEKNYCDRDTCIALCEIGYSIVNYELAGSIHLYDAQKFLREQKDIFIYPAIDKFLDEEGNTIWITYMYIPYVSVRAICKRKTYEDALLEGIKEAIIFI